MGVFCPYLKPPCAHIGKNKKPIYLINYLIIPITPYWGLLLPLTGMSLGTRASCIYTPDGPHLASDSCEVLALRQ